MMQIRTAMLSRVGNISKYHLHCAALLSGAALECPWCSKSLVAFHVVDENEEGENDENDEDEDLALWMAWTSSADAEARAVVSA